MGADRRGRPDGLHRIRGRRRPVPDGAPRGKRFTDFPHAASGSVQDVRRWLQGRTYVGTDHVFRLNGPRVEAFSGLDVTLFELLGEGRAEEYRALVHAERDIRPRLLWGEQGNGPLSVRADGSVLALRVLPPGGEHDPTFVPGT